MTKYSANPMIRMKAMLALMLLLTGILAPMAHAQSGPYAVRIENNTRYSIYEVHMSRTGDTRWRRDLLGDDTLNPGYVFTTHLYAGLYDLKLVDEDGDVCEVRNVAVTGTTTWSITSRWLLNCELH